MQQDVQGGHEEISSRHPLAALPFGAILTFVGVRRRRWQASRVPAAW
jgi:hypothetical protein